MISTLIIKGISIMPEQSTYLEGPGEIFELITGIIKNDLNSEFKTKIFRTDFRGVGFQTIRMDEYLPENGTQTYHYWVEIDKKTSYLKCFFTLYPVEKSQEIISKMNKILEKLTDDKQTVTNINKTKKILINECKLNNRTSSVIAKAAEDMLTVAIKRTFVCLDKIVRS